MVYGLFAAENGGMDIDLVESGGGDKLYIRVCLSEVGSFYEYEFKNREEVEEFHLAVNDWLTRVKKREAP